MRLNRVLLLAVAMSMAFIATVFTISCSDGEKGADGASCVISELGDGSYDVLCGGNSVGTLGTPNGQKGPQGPQGLPGPDCELAAGIGGTYQITCAGVLKGILEGCHTEENIADEEIIITCLGSTVIGLCGFAPNVVEVFNPSLDMCATGSVSPGGNASYCGPDSLRFNPHFQYCGFLNEAALKAGTPSLIKLCPDTSSAFSHYPNEAEVQEEWNTLEGIPSDSNTVWRNEYCQVSVALNATDSAKVDTIYKVSVPELCGSSKVKLNDNSWNREYCGYANEDTNFKSVVNNACGDGGKPDSLAFGYKFCGMLKKTNKFTYTRGEEETGAYGAFCLVGADSVRTPLNAVAKDVVTSTDWRDEYCGFASKAADTTGIASVRTGICTDGKGPNDIDDRWDNEYCQGVTLTPAAGKKLVAAKTASGADSTVRTSGGSAAYCMKDADANYETAPVSARLNEGRWLNQYCGFASKADAENENYTRLTGVCDDGTGPNSDGWGAEYCQVTWTSWNTYKINYTTKVSGDPTTYCVAADSLVPVTQSYQRAMNKDTWQGQYCGYSSRGNYDNSFVAGTAGVKFTKAVITNGYCEDGGKPNETAWTNQFCQWQISGNQVLKDPAAITAGADLLALFCPSDTSNFRADRTTYAKDTTAQKFINTSNRLNVTKPAAGKYQYCGYSNYAGACSNAACVTGAKIVFQRYDTPCYNGFTYGYPNKFLATDVPANRWRNEYCQGQWGQQVGKTSLASLLVANALNSDDSQYCGSASATVPMVANYVGNTAKLNAGSWQGQFCTSDKVVKACTGGQEPKSPTPASTDAILCVSPAGASSSSGAGSSSSSAIVVTGIAVGTTPTATSFATGDNLDLTGMIVTITWSDASTTSSAAWTNSGAASGFSTSPVNGAALTCAGPSNCTETITITHTASSETAIMTVTVTP